MIDKLKEILAALQGMAGSVRADSQGEIQFKMALAALQQVIDTPAPAPEKVIQTEVATGEMARLVAEQVLTGLAALHDAGIAQAVQMGEARDTQIEGIITQITSLSDHVGIVETAVEGANVKLDGMEDTLGAFISSQETVPA